MFSIFNNDNNGEYKFIKEFKKQTLVERKEISKKILIKYPNRIPIIVDSKKDINLDKNKYIVPENLTVGQFMCILKKRIKTNSYSSVFLKCNDTIISNTDVIKILYYNKKNEDGFLYIKVILENTFGN